MTIYVSTSSPKIPKSGIFGTKFKDFYFCTKLWNKTNYRTLISNMRIIFSNSIPKIQKSDKEILVFVLHETLQQDKFEGADFKYDNGISKFLPKTLK